MQIVSCPFKQQWIQESLFVRWYNDIVAGHQLWNVNEMPRWIYEGIQAVADARARDGR